MPTLYRKYRPQKFEDVIGQDSIVQTLTNEIKLGKTAQAYLFSGPRGVGKTTLARLLAKSINCQNRAPGEYEPCETCSSCTEITAGRNIDVIEIDAASHTQVDNVRENIIENSQFKPTQSKFKIFIIDEVHMLSNASFNALLKTVEEPPAHVVFIMATTELHKLPDTVISRCQRFGFKKITYDEMKTRLEKILKEEDVKIDKEVIDRIINKSDGCLRDAESLMGQILSLNLKNISAADAAIVMPTSDVGEVINFAEQLIGRNATEALATIGRLAGTGVNFDEFAHDLVEVLRIAMIIQAGQNNNTTDYSEDNLKRIKKMSTLATSKDLVKLIDMSMARRREIKTSPLPSLPLELLAIEWSAHTAPDDENKKSSTPPTAAVSGPKDVPFKTESKGPETHTISQSIKAVVDSITHKHAPATITLEQVQACWPEFVKKISETNHSLTFILKMCTLCKIDAEGLELSVPFAFHKDKLEDKVTKKMLDTKLSELLNERVFMHCVVAENQPAEEKPVDGAAAVNDLAAEFGGEVVVE